jgi:Calx-beta domain
VLVNGDVVNETNETFFVNLSNAAGGTIADGQGLGTITNDDGAPPSISIGDATVTEGNTGTATASFVVSLSSAPSAGQTVTVDYATADGTATVADGDYTNTIGGLSFAAGETSKTVTVLVNGDTRPESNETFFVNLSNAVGGTIADGQGAGTITNDDGPPPVPSVSINDVTGAEGNAGLTPFSFTVTLSAASSSTVTVHYNTLNGSARAGSDYQFATGTVTFNPGETSKPVVVNVIGDTVRERAETFLVRLSSPDGAHLGRATGRGTITNDD